MIVSFFSFRILYTLFCCLTAVLEINFEESDYSFREGSDHLSSLVRLQFRETQNPFIITLYTATINETLSKGLGGMFILAGNNCKFFSFRILYTLFCCLTAVLEINVEESDYSFREGSDRLSSLVRLQFRETQNPFIITLYTATINETLSKGLGGMFILAGPPAATAGN